MASRAAPPAKRKCHPPAARPAPASTIQDSLISSRDVTRLRPWHLIVLLAIAVRLVPASLTFGTSDVLAWDLLARLFLNGENFYASQLHNWPVLWIYFTAGATLAHAATGLPFSTLVK